MTTQAIDARAPEFLAAMDHVDNAETEKAKAVRLAKLAAQLGTTIEACLEARAALPTQRDLICNEALLPDGYYTTTRAIPNPHVDRRASGSIAALDVIPAGTTVVVRRIREPDGTVFGHEVELYGLATRERLTVSSARPLRYMILLNLKPRAIQTLSDVVRVDDVRDHHYKRLVMQLFADGKLGSLDDLRCALRAVDLLPGEEVERVSLACGYPYAKGE